MNDRVSSPSNPGWYWLAYLTGGFGLGFNAVMTFLLALHANALGIEIAVIGLLLGAKGAVEAVVSVPVGGLIDRIGPRRAFIIGVSSCTLVVGAYGSATTVVFLLVLQMAVGVFRPMAWVASQSFVSGLRKGADQARDTGRFSSVATGSQVVAPLLVGFAAQASDTGTAFYVFAGYCAIFVVVGLLIPKGADAGSKHATKRRGLISGVRLLEIRGIRVVMFLTFARLWISTAFVAFFPLLLVIGGTAEGVAATVVSAAAIVATIVAPISGRLARHIRVETVAALALLSGAIGLALAPLLDSIPFAYLVSVFVGVGAGLSLPALLVLVSRSVSADRRGLALGLRVGVSQLAAALAPVLVASVIGATAAATGFVLAAGIGAGFIAFARFTSRRGRESQLKLEGPDR